MKLSVWALVCLSFLLSQSFNSNGQISLAADSCATTVRYYKRNELAVVPVMINDTLQVNMLLDPRCKTVVLFGKRFEKLMRESIKNGNGTEKMKGELFLDNTIEVGQVKATNIRIAVVPNRDPMNFFLSINGVIGYNVFRDFQIVRDQKHQILTFIPKDDQQIYTLLPVEEDDRAH